MARRTILAVVGFIGGSTVLWKTNIFQKPPDTANDLQQQTSGNDTRNLTLQQVQIFLRHGPRTPIKLSPSTNTAPPDEQVEWPVKFILSRVFHSEIDVLVTNLDGGPRQQSAYETKYQKTQYKGGLSSGVLTSLGRDQMYAFGRQLRKDYMEKLQFLSFDYDPSDVYVRSTNINRNIESICCILAGMYGREQMISKGPVRIPVSNTETEVLFPNPNVCASYRPIYRAAMIDGADLIDRSDKLAIEKVLGIDSSKDKVNLVDVRDDIVGKKIHGIPVSKEMGPFTDMIEQYATTLLEYAICGQQKESNINIIRISTGRAIRLILDNIHNVYHEDSRQKSPKMYLFSTHDSLLVGLLGALNINWNVCPPFGVAIRFELYSDETDNQWIRVMYGEKVQVVRGCSEEFCPLEKFIEAITPYSIQEREYRTLCDSTSALVK